MRHLDDGELQALCDGELSEAARRLARAHLAECSLCGANHAELRAGAAAVAGALAIIDRPAPPRAVPLSPGERGAHRPAAVKPRRAEAGRWRWRRAALPRAAVVLLGFAAAASATLPGSPVREWLTRADAEGGPPVVLNEPVAQAERAALEPATPPESGVFVEPAAGQLRVRVLDAHPDLRLRALLTDGQRGGVYAVGEAAHARFRTGAGSIEVIGVGPGELRIEIPRSLARASLEVDGQTYLVKQDGQLLLSVEPEDSAAAEVLFRVRP